MSDSTLSLSFFTRPSDHPPVFVQVSSPLLLTAFFQSTNNQPPTHHIYAFQSVVTFNSPYQIISPHRLTAQGLLNTCKASSRVNMKPQTMILVGISLLHGVVGLTALESPGTSSSRPHCVSHDEANLQVRMRVQMLGQFQIRQHLWQGQ